MTTRFTELLQHADRVDPNAANDLLLELGARNHVRVKVNRARTLGRRTINDRSEVVYDSLVDRGVVFAHKYQAALVDGLRMISGLDPLWVPEAVRASGAEFVGCTPNLRTNIGIDYTASALGDASGSRAAVAQYIALSNCTGTTAATDTTATTGASGTGINWGTANATDAAAGTGRGEYTALGMQRAAGTYAHTATVTSYSLAKTFTATSAITNVQACALTNNATQGVASSLTSALYLENTFTATTLANADQLTLTWTVNI
jgi:hypothetical protein